MAEAFPRHGKRPQSRVAGQAGERFNAVRYSSAEYLLTFQRRLEGRGSGKSRSSQAFNIRFENFNSATSYSGPAALRLLKSVCGQPSHEDLYEGRNPDCEIMNRLARLGYNQHVFMDHSGKYDNFYQSLRHLAGLSPQLAEMKYPKRYDSFDEEPIGDARAVFKDYENTIAADQGRQKCNLYQHDRAA